MREKKVNVYFFFLFLFLSITGWLHTCQAFEVVALLLTLLGVLFALVAQLKGKSFSSFYQIGGALILCAGECVC